MVKMLETKKQLLKRKKRGRKMSEEKKLAEEKIENKGLEAAETENDGTGEDVEGYKVCTTYTQRCSQDCWFVHTAVASAIE